MEKILPHLKELLLIPILILSIGWVASPLTNANESEIPEVTVPENNLSMEIHASLNGKPIEEKFYVLWLEIYNPEIYYPSDKEPLNDDERKIIDAIGPAKELLLTRSDWINLCKSSSSTLRILSVQCENLYERYTQTGPGEESGIGKECGETKGVPSEVCAAFSPFVDRSDEQSFKYWAPAHYNTHITTCSNSSCYFYDNIGTYGI
jgi:hypothetical protein